MDEEEKKKSRREKERKIKCNKLHRNECRHKTHAECEQALNSKSDRNTESEWKKKKERQRTRQNCKRTIKWLPMTNGRPANALKVLKRFLLNLSWWALHFQLRQQRHKTNDVLKLKTECGMSNEEGWISNFTVRRTKCDVLHKIKEKRIRWNEQRIETSKALLGWCVSPRAYKQIAFDGFLSNSIESSHRQSSSRKRFDWIRCVFFFNWRKCSRFPFIFWLTWESYFRARDVTLCYFWRSRKARAFC